MIWQSSFMCSKRLDKNKKESEQDSLDDTTRERVIRWSSDTHWSEDPIFMFILEMDNIVKENIKKKYRYA